MDNEKVLALLERAKKQVLLKMLKIAYTYTSETIQVLEGWSDKVLLTTNTTFDCEFFSFCKQTAATEPTLCHAVA